MRHSRRRLVLLRLYRHSRQGRPLIWERVRGGSRARLQTRSFLPTGTSRLLCVLCFVFLFCGLCFGSSSFWFASFSWAKWYPTCFCSTNKRGASPRPPAGQSAPNARYQRLCVDCRRGDRGFVLVEARSWTGGTMLGVDGRTGRGGVGPRGRAAGLTWAVRHPASFGGEVAAAAVITQCDWAPD